MNKHNRAHLSAWVAVAIFLCLCTGLWAKEEFQARLFPDLAQGSQKATKLIISIDSYTNSEEVLQLIQTFNNRGYEQFRATLHAMNKGTLRPTGGRGVQIILHAAQSTPTDKGRNIILVAESQSWSLDSRLRYDGRFPLMVIELSLNEKGKGKGNIYLSADIKLTGQGTIEMTGYSSPQRQLFGVAVMK